MEALQAREMSTHPRLTSFFSQSAWESIPVACLIFKALRKFAAHLDGSVFLPCAFFILALYLVLISPQ